MDIDGKLPQGYIVICAHGHPARSFLVKRLGPSVECPECGRTALSTELAGAYHARFAAAARRQPMPAAAGWPVPGRPDDPPPRLRLGL
ncbi:MAG: hypothetical protein U1E53_25610 [Dongiaceae bacterium]